MASSRSTNAAWLEAFRTHAMSTYDPAPVAFARGRGCRLWDVEGAEYLDFAAGVAVCSLGHAPPRVVQAVAAQAAELMHTSNLYLVPRALELAERLVHISGLSKAFFCNSGTEAVEAALKLARYWGSQRGGRAGIVAANRSFHGRTLGALSVTGQPNYQKGFLPLLPGVTFVPFGDADALREAVTATTCAVVLEPVQGEGGVHVPPAGYLKAARQICDDRDALLVLDEVQTGVGRTGSWFAYQEAGVAPDIVALAKGLGSGFPIGAVLCNDRANAFRPGAHGSTFGGNPLAAAAALATLEAIEKDGVLANVRAQGSRLAAHLGRLARDGLVRNPRGVGLLAAFDLPQGDAKGFARRLLADRLLVSNIGEATIRLCPPLVVGAAEVDEAVARLTNVLTAPAVAAHGNA